MSITQELLLQWDQNHWTIITAAVSLFVVSRIVKLINGLKAVGYIPGLRVPFEPLALPGVAIPTSWWNPGYKFPWKWRHRFYREHASESVSVVPFIKGTPSIYTCNLDVARQVVAGGNRSSWIKPESKSQGLLLWGMNLVSSEGEVWRKHRRIMGPAFNNDLYQLVWAETSKTYYDMVATGEWSKIDVIDVPAVQSLTFKLALLIIGKCGFGFPFDWQEPPTALDGTISVQEALRIVADTTTIVLAAPKTIRSLPFQIFKKIRQAYTKLAEFMDVQVAERKAEVRGGGSSRKDAFTMLIQANEDEAGKLNLDDGELIGNVFIMLFAGHETTAHTLAATLALLALHEDIQEEVSEHVLSVIGQSRDPEFSDYSRLTKVLAIFYEALRMFPAGHLLIREATEDTILNVPKPPGQEGSSAVPITKGTQVVVDMVGVQYNPRYFDEPEKFKPWRWLGIANESEQFTAFSIGPRACIGRKFATVESVCFLSLLLRDWKVVPTLKKGETRDQWGARVMDVQLAVTLGILDVPITFIRRTRS
ncbi:hypothetical protein AX16_005717 [Volvariella volvacea WC 439]|nr:hypothetical protein AX16_005717 [Volvariella volvacea WC 439]